MRQVLPLPQAICLPGSKSPRAAPPGFWTSADSLSVEQRIKLRSILVNYNIQVLDDLDGNMQIYVEGELVGEWRKCTYKLKRDIRELDPRKQLYLEMLVDCWTVFEEDQEL
jgi:hypothetical protein